MPACVTWFNPSTMTGGDGSGYCGPIGSFILNIVIVIIIITMTFTDEYAPVFMMQRASTLVSQVVVGGACVALPT